MPGLACGVKEGAYTPPQACFKVDGSTLIVVREPKGPARNVTWTVGLNVSAAWPFPVENETVLVAECNGRLTSSSNYAYGYTPLTLQVISEPVETYVVNVTVYVYAYYGTVNAYLFADGRVVWSETGITGYIAATVRDFKARNVTLYVNSSGTAYAIIAYEAYYYEPVYNSTVLALDAPLVYLEAAGRGSIAVGGVNETVTGDTIVVVSASPPLVAINGSLVEAQPGQVTVAASCYGSNVTSVMVVHYAYANITRFELEGFESYSYTPKRQQVINLNATFSTKPVAQAVADAAAAAVSVAGLAMSVLLPAPWYPVGLAVLLPAAATGSPVALGSLLAGIGVVLYRSLREEV